MGDGMGGADRDYECDGVRLMLGDCRVRLAELDEGSIDSCVTDPPYDLLTGKGRGFMGKAWDGTGVAFDPETWRAVLRILKPGAYLAAFGGTRTYHRMTCAIEDAGFEIRDTIGDLFDNAPYADAFFASLTDEQRRLMDRAFPGDGLASWVYATGFPKGMGNLKPAFEPIVLARKPGPKVLPLGIDECRIPTSESTLRTQRGTTKAWEGGAFSGERVNGSTEGRYPANLIHDGSDATLEAFAAFGERKSGGGDRSGTASTQWGGELKATAYPRPYESSTGTAARFYMQCAYTQDETQNAIYFALNERLEIDIIDTTNTEECRCRFANNAELISSPILPQNSDSAPRSVVLSPFGSNDQNANCAATQCGQCETSIARSPAKAKVRTESDLKVAFTTATENELRLLSESLIATIRTFESASSPGSQPGRLTLSFGRVNSVAIRRPTGITTITINRWKSDGSADAATFRLTSRNSGHGVSGSPPSRFMYAAKASQAERGDANHHPTVKPVALIEHLVKLTCPVGGTVLDPFVGSGTTAKACIRSGRSCIGIDADAGHHAIAVGRVEAERQAHPLFA